MQTPPACSLADSHFAAMEVAASVAGFTALADLVTRYSELIAPRFPLHPQVDRRTSRSAERAARGPVSTQRVNLIILRQDVMRELADDLRDNPSF